MLIAQMAFCVCIKKNVFEETYGIYNCINNSILFVILILILIIIIFIACKKNMMKHIITFFRILMGIMAVMAILSMIFFFNNELFGFFVVLYITLFEISLSIVLRCQKKKKEMGEYTRNAKELIDK